MKSFPYKILIQIITQKQDETKIHPATIYHPFL